MLRNPSTHTQYAHSRRKQYAAIANILNLRRFLFVDNNTSYAVLRQKIHDNIDAYLVPVDRSNSPLQMQINTLENNQRLDFELKRRKIQQKQKLLNQYSERYLYAVDCYQQHRSQLQTLIDSNNYYLAHEIKQDQYLYMIDEETTRHLCLADNKAASCRRSFSNKHDIELRNNQTDAVRVWRNNITLSQLSINDYRTYMTIAHRDAIQLIPPPLYEEISIGNTTSLIKLADQMAGTVLENVTISNCVINAPKGALQGIFASDGMCRNLKIRDTSIATKGAHSISIAGALTGCEIKNITLQQVKGGNVPEIALYPLRIGGNMADDGVVYIFSFSANAEYRYGQIKTDNNKRYLWNQTDAEEIEVNDYRQEIPHRYFKIAFGLNNFNYSKYFQEYTQWTMADFKRILPHQFTNMTAWIDLRVAEYASGQRLSKQSPLAPPSAEQTNPKQHGVLDMLIQAQTALSTNSNDFNNTRLPEIAQTAIRSFSMKCIALRNGEVQPLYDLGTVSNRIRKASLGFLLDKKHFSNLLQNPNQAQPVPIEVIEPIELISSSIIRTAEGFINSIPHIIVQGSTRVQRGEDIVFELDTLYENVSYFWLFGNYQSTERQISKVQKLVLHTRGLAVGDQQRVRLSITNRKRNQIHLSYYFDVLAEDVFDFET
jgi:hypothetical protein